MNLRRVIFLLTIGALLMVIAIVANPINITSLKIGWLGAIGFFWFGLFYLNWQRRWLRFLLLVVLGILALPWLLPGRDIDSSSVRADYTDRLESYEDVKYYWGGENSRGIDCSGLPRRAYRDSLLHYGLKTLNGRATRAFLENWWFDSSAKALSEGYRKYTRALGVDGTISEMSYDQLKPGDLAITSSGVHVVVFLGGDKWIQADPGPGKVLINQGRSDSNPWLRTSVGMFRWRYLD